jgi:uncharacterized protein (DUF1697 family)
MTKFIALLRGINVSGHKIIRMADLKRMFERLKYDNVQTYLQSGNVVFEAKGGDQKKLAATIHAAIVDDFEFDVEVVVLPAADMIKIAASNPFSELDEKWLYVTFPFKPVNKTDFTKVKMPIKIGEKVVLVGKVIYGCCPHGYGNTKINNTFFEKALVMPTTTRNWRTVTALAQLCSAT